MQEVLASLGGWADYLRPYMAAYAPFFQIASVASPMAILIAALWAWRVQVGVLKRRASWEYVIEHEQSREWIELSHKVRLVFETCSKEELREAAEKWSSRTLITDTQQNDSWLSVFQWLNRKEAVGLAVLKGAMHRRLYRLWWGAVYVEEWKMAQEFVSMLRDTNRGNGSTELFKYFEKLAHKWRRVKK